MTNDASRIAELYDRLALDYDADRSRALFEKPWLDRFLSLVPPSGEILDMGCGSGEPIAHYLIERGFKLVGVDSSPTLIGICATRFPEHEWIVADMRQLSLGRRFEGILAWDSFFHLSPEDQRLMFPRFRDHAAPGGALMFTTGTSHGESLGTYRGEKLYHGSLDAREYRDLLDVQGFSTVSYVEDDPACGHHTIWLAKLGQV